MRYGKGFNPRDLVVLGRKDGDLSNLIAFYENDFKGQVYVHIREIWPDKDGNYNPGKGVSFSLQNKGAILGALKVLAHQYNAETDKKINVVLAASDITDGRTLTYPK